MQLQLTSLGIFVKFPGGKLMFYWNECLVDVHPICGYSN
jgi:hypothetical protein